MGGGWKCHRGAAIVCKKGQFEVQFDGFYDATGVQWELWPQFGVRAMRCFC